MTAKQTAPPTPYDESIADCSRAAIEAKYKREREDALMGLMVQRHRREGYLRAVEDYAPLLEAAEAIEHNMASPQTAGWVRLRTAIARARGEQP